LACTAAATVVSGKQFRWPGGDFARGRRGESERRGRGFYRRGSEAVLVSGVKGAGAARSMATVSSERKLLGVEGGSDRWVPSISEKETEGKKEGGVSGVLLGCCFGPAQGAVVFFLCCFFSYFLFSYFFHRFCIKASNNVKPISNLF
jgi:hypothetical protein